MFSEFPTLRECSENSIQLLVVKMQDSDGSGVEGSSVAAGASSGTGKRKWDENRGRGVSGFGSTYVKQQLGVKDRRSVEIKPWVEGASFIMDVTGMSLQQAAMVHDLAWAYANPGHLDVEQLNIQSSVEEVILNKALLGPTPSADELKKFLIGFVRKHPLKEGLEWVDNSVKDDIAALAPLAFQELEEWITEELYQAGAGFRKLDLGELFPAVEGGEPLEASENAKEAEVFNLQTLMMMILTPPGAPEPESSLTDLNKYLLREIQRLEALLEAKDAEIASLQEERESGF